MLTPPPLANGRYRFVEPLGTGRTSTVWRVVDQRMGVERAVKILVPGLSTDPDAVARFRAEARTLARLRHPNLVRVHDAGLDGRRMFLVMDLNAGSIADQLRNGPVTTPRAVGWVCGMLAGLEAAHEAGIVHRDLKPENVLLAADGTPQVGDFGIARIRDLDAELTDTGATLGTAAYMAPEQHVDAKRVDARADVYAAGAVLYRLLTGRRPYALFQDGERDARFDGLPSGLRPIIARATRFAPSDRYASASAMRDALLADAAPLPRVHRPLLGVVAAAGLGLLLGMACSL